MQLTNHDKVWAEQYPIYLNPTYTELEQLAQQRWDTVRVITVDDDICLASGYGNTHETLMRALRYHYNRNNLIHADSYVMYREKGFAYFNLEDVSGERYAKFSVWSEFFSDKQNEILGDLAKLSGLEL